MNGLNACERTIIGREVKAGTGEVLYDFDAYYLNNKEQEAGHYFRAYQKDAYLKGNLDEIKEQIRIQLQSIKVIQVPLEAGQAKVIGDLIQQGKLAQDPSQTAIVLPRQNMLFPLLHSLPEEAGDYNVTLSYPLRQTAPYRFLKELKELHLKAQATGAQTLLYFRPVFRLLNSSLLPKALRQLLRDALGYLRRKDAVYFYAERISQPVHTAVEEGRLESAQVELVDLLLDHSSCQKHPIDYLQHVLVHMDGLLPEQSLEREYLAQFYKSLDQLNQALKQASIEADWQAVLDLALQYAGDAALPFVGDPLKGLQILGVLESVGLDFRQVIIPDMNEDAFPPAHKASSYIPYNLRKGFGLPVVEDHDAQYAWYFYRLLQRSKELVLLSNNFSSPKAKGYLSRYVFQLENELIPSQQKAGSQQPVLEKINMQEDFRVRSVPEIKIPRSPATVQKILSIMGNGPGAKGLSASAFNTWLDCRLKYYFQYIAQMQEPDVVEEEIEPNVIGTIFHDVMEELYQPALKGQKWVTEGYLEKARAKVDQTIQAKMEAVLFSEKGQELSLSGKRMLIKNQVRNWVMDQLDYDGQRLPFAVLYLEEKWMGELEIEHREGEKQIIKLSGKADRVEKKDQELRIIDYKTGSAKRRFKTVEELFKRDDLNRNKYVLQVFFYSYLFHNAYKESAEQLAGMLYVAREMGNFGRRGEDPYLEKATDESLAKNKKPKYGPYLDISGDLPKFRALLEEELRDLMDPEGFYEQTSEVKICNYCPYNVICQRK